MIAKAIIIIDPCSRDKLKSINDFNHSEFIFRSCLAELTPDLITDIKKVILFEGILSGDTTISDIILYKTLYNLEFFFVSDSTEWFPLLSVYVHCSQHTLESMALNDLNNVLYNSNSIKPNLAKQSVGFIELAKKMVEDKTINNLFSLLAKDYLNIQSELTRQLETNRQLQNASLKREAIIGKLQKENKKLSEGYLELVQQIYQHNETLQIYENYLTKDIYEKVDLQKFSNRPVVFYFKEYEELLGLHEFIFTLSRVFRDQYDRSVKVLELFDNSESIACNTIPAQFHLLQSVYTKKELYAFEYLAKVGDYRDILEVILENRQNSDILFVVDRKGYQDVILRGDFIQYNLCREFEHLELLNLSKYNTISNKMFTPSITSESLVWDHQLAKGVISSEDTQKFLVLSSQTIIKDCIEKYKSYAV